MRRLGKAPLPGIQIASALYRATYSGRKTTNWCPN